MSFPTRLEELLEEGRMVVRGMVKFEFGGGTYGVWTGNYELVHESVTYVPNQLVTAELADDGLGMEASEMTIEMPEASDFGITPDTLKLIEQEDYKGKPVTVYEAYFDPDTRALLHVEPLGYGYADTIDHLRDNGLARLVGHVISGALDNHRDGFRSASNEDQQLVSAGDKFFAFASSVKNEKFDIEL